MFLVFSGALFAQAVSPTATPSPTPMEKTSSKLEMYMDSTDILYGKGTAVSIQPTSSPTPEPTPTPAPDFTVTGGIKFTSSYYGPGGDPYRKAFDQQVWVEAQYKFAYCGMWASLQSKEYDPYCGFRYNTGKIKHDTSYTFIHYQPDNVNINAIWHQSTVTVVEKKNFSADVYGRMELYLTHKHDGLTSGAYLSAGTVLNFNLKKDWTFMTNPYLLYDTGTYNLNKGFVFLSKSELKKKVGKFQMGPGLEFGTDINTGDRKAHASAYFAITF
jgi:hypothetical protein